MPETDTREAFAFGVVLVAVTLTVAIALLVSLWVVAPTATGSHPPTAPENGTTPTPTTTDEWTPDCPETPSAHAGRCADVDGDGTPEYRCVDNVDCGDDTPPTRNA